jgi:Tol biopolymer transport system component
VWAVPTTGGALREYRRRAVELDWTSDGKRVVFHTTDPGDPLFVAGTGDDTPAQVYVAPRGVHCHYPIWAPDDATIYFVRGLPPDAMDLWRLAPGASEPERLTHHNSRVEYPAFIDANTVLYLATTPDGAGPWLYGFDIAQRSTRRIGFGFEQYTSLSSSADGSRLAATVERGKTSLWRVPISNGPAAEEDAARIELPTVAASAPRLGPGFLLYVAAKNDGHAIWKLVDGKATELWSGAHARVVGGPAVSPDGRRAAFVAEGPDGTRLFLLDRLDVDRAVARELAPRLEVRGMPTWAPDGTALAVAVSEAGGLRLYRVQLEGGEPTALGSGYAINPQWSPDGRFIVYADADVGPDFVLKAVDVRGRPHALPPISLPRGAKRVAMLPGAHALVVLEGGMRHTNFWRVDLDTGERRQLTNFGSEYTIRDFDVSADGREIVFDRRRDNSDIVLIERRSL